MSMYEILRVEKLAEKIVLMDVRAERVGRYCEPGQFVIIRLDEKGERIPLTICDYNREQETVTIVFQAVGATTEKMLRLGVGDSFKDFVGPLGCAASFILAPGGASQNAAASFISAADGALQNAATEFVKEEIDALKKKKFLFVAGGVGAAPVYPQVKWLHEQGIGADVIVGVRNAEMLILEKEMRAVAGNLYIATDDGSVGHHGLVTDVIKKLVLEDGQKYDECIVIGPMVMMKFVSLLTKEFEIPTTVSMNSIMVDGTGMCGACRITVGDEVKFACVDGPEFDGHLVDFDEAMKRQQMYSDDEAKAMLKLKENHSGGCGCTPNGRSPQEKSCSCGYSEQKKSCCGGDQ